MVCDLAWENGLGKSVGIQGGKAERGRVGEGKWGKAKKWVAEGVKRRTVTSDVKV